MPALDARCGFVNRSEHGFIAKDRQGMTVAAFAAKSRSFVSSSEPVMAGGREHEGIGQTDGFVLDALVVRNDLKTQKERGRPSPPQC